MKTVAIIGRPNVGKSTLFNRFLRRRVSIVDKTSGVTRDRLAGGVEWQGRKFTVLDTGGVDLEFMDLLQEEVLSQIKLAIAESDLIIFLTDVKTGLTPLDSEIARLLRQSGKKVLMVVNKVDNLKQESGVHSFSQLGWERVMGVSAAHGLGIGELLDVIVAEIPEEEAEVSEPQPLKVAVVGRPNVGKSTFINAVLNEHRVIVDKKPGTTRDAVDIKFNRKGSPWLFIDTAGMRKRSKVNDPVEFYSVRRAYRSINRADIVVLMIDGWDGIRKQEMQLLDYIAEHNRPCVIAVNKWDLVVRVSKREYRERIAKRLGQYWFIPAVFISSLKKKNLDEVLQKVEDLFVEAQERVSTGKFNKLLQGLEPARTVKIYYGTQTAVNPLTFLLFVNKDPGLRYTSYISNQIRKMFRLQVPLRIQFRPRKVKK